MPLPMIPSYNIFTQPFQQINKEITPLTQTLPVVNNNNNETNETILLTQPLINEMVV